MNKVKEEKSPYALCVSNKRYSLNNSDQHYFLLSFVKT